MINERLPDRWVTRDFPVLLETARLVDAGENLLQDHQLVSATGFVADDVQSAWHALNPTYIRVLDLGQSAEQTRPDLAVQDLTERGRRAVGLWPSGEDADALVTALRQAEELVDDPEEKTLIRRAAGAIGSVSRDVMVDVMAAVLARQSGIG